MKTKSFLQKNMIKEINEKSSLHSMRSTFLKYAERTSEKERQCFLAMFRAVTIIFTKPVNLEKKATEYKELNEKCISTLKKYADQNKDLQLYLEIFEFNCDFISGSRSLSA